MMLSNNCLILARNLVGIWYNFTQLTLNENLFKKCIINIEIDSSIYLLFRKCNLNQIYVAKLLSYMLVQIGSMLINYECIN